MGSWCYVDAKTCTYPSLNDTTGQSYGWCQNNQSTTTYDTGARPALPRKGLCGCSACRLHTGLHPRRSAAISLSASRGLEQEGKTLWLTPRPRPLRSQDGQLLHVPAELQCDRRERRGYARHQRLLRAHLARRAALVPRGGEQLHHARHAPQRPRLRHLPQPGCAAPPSPRTACRRRGRMLWVSCALPRRCFTSCTSLSGQA
jgi:hypothetical protein